jgi:hypothetical protein
MHTQVIVIPFELCGIDTIVIRHDGMINISDAIRKSTLEKSGYTIMQCLLSQSTSYIIDELSNKYNVPINRIIAKTSKDVYLNICLLPGFLAAILVGAEEELKNYTVEKLNEKISSNIIYVRNNAIIAKIVC